jgi:hypothetical protein
MGRDAKSTSWVLMISRAASGELAEAQHHERAVAPREVPQGAVRRRAGEVV